MTPFEGYESMQVELTEGVVLATLDRPEKMNAFDGPLRRSVRRLIDEVRDVPEARVLVVTGAGGNFCSGADLTAADRSPVPAAGHDPMFQWCVDLLELPKPTIAAIDGVAAGGGLGMALCCDIRICSTRARLIPVWLKRAIHPDDLVTWTLPRLVGTSRALMWLYLADDIPLEEAAATGLVNDLCPPTDVVDRAMALARRLAAGPTLHYALTKQAVLRNLTREPVDAAMIEDWGQQRAFASADFKEGLRAFKERRPPQFEGR